MFVFSAFRIVVVMFYVFLRHVTLRKFSDQGHSSCVVLQDGSSAIAIQTNNGTVFRLNDRSEFILRKLEEGLSIKDVVLSYGSHCSVSQELALSDVDQVLSMIS